MVGGTSSWQLREGKGAGEHVEASREKGSSEGGGIYMAAADGWAEAEGETKAVKVLEGLPVLG